MRRVGRREQWHIWPGCTSGYCWVRRCTWRSVPQFKQPEEADPCISCKVQHLLTLPWEAHGSDACSRRTWTWRSLTGNFPDWILQPSQFPFLRGRYLFKSIQTLKMGLKAEFREINCITRRELSGPLMLTSDVQQMRRASPGLCCWRSPLAV